MKRCPKCNRVETDEALKFCRIDGATLIIESEAETAHIRSEATDYKAERIFWFDLSRDGKQIALARGTESSDVILIRDFR